MEAERFDLVTRALGDAPTRRTVFGLVLGGVFGSALDFADAKKKGKKKKKKCKGGKKKCGKKCIPATSCCAACGACESCQDGTCVSDCQAGQACVAGQCQCTAESCDGCCDGENCRSGTASAFCGTDGETCDACSGSETCQAGDCVCVPDSCAFNCGADLNCHCLATVGTGQPFCGVLLGLLNANCAVDCLPSETCVDVSDCGGTTACATPCPNP
jgi:hypothetical protein